MEFHDATGAIVSLAAPPRRIVSLIPSITEILFAVGAGDAVAGCTVYCTEPPDGVATKTRVQFEQFFSAELVRELERDPTLLEGRSQEVTVLVSDLRGFTSLSERLGPETTCRVVRDIMEHLSERIMSHGGVIVDYAGDGILAMWNAPVPQEDHVPRACQAALAMVRERQHRVARADLATLAPRGVRPGDGGVPGRREKS